MARPRQNKLKIFTKLFKNNYSYVNSFEYKHLKPEADKPAMGSWQLEVGRMAFYVMFPVGMFHIFNQPEFYEKKITEYRDFNSKLTNLEGVKIIERAKEKKYHESLERKKNLELM